MQQKSDAEHRFCMHAMHKKSDGLFSCTKEEAVFFFLFIPVPLFRLEHIQEVSCVLIKSIKAPILVPCSSFFPQYN